jgi:hypothetical protein
MLEDNVEVDIDSKGMSELNNRERSLSVDDPRQNLFSQALESLPPGFQFFSSPVRKPLSNPFNEGNGEAH